MKLKSGKIAMVLWVVLATASANTPVMAAKEVILTSSGSRDAKTGSLQQIEDALQKDLSTLVKEFYGKAKITRVNDKIHFEYKARTFTAPGGRMEVAPDFGGVIGDLEIKPGPYTGKAKLPQINHEYGFYSTMLMAPYCEKHNCHLYTRLAFSSDTTPEFQERFKDLVNDFDKIASVFDASARIASSEKSEETKKSESVSNSKIETKLDREETKGPKEETSLTAKESDKTASEDKESPSKPEETTDTGNSASNMVATVSGVAPQASATTPAIATAPQPKAFLWRATKGSDTLYLLGTIHGAIAKFYPLPAVVDQAFDHSKHLMVEIAIDKADVSNLGKLRDQVSQYKPPDHLTKHLTPTTKKVFEDYLKWSGESWEMYEKYKPHRVAELAAQSKRWIGPDFRSSLGLDLYFLGRARESGKAISDLETVELQINIEKDLPDAAEDMILRTSIMGFKDMDKEIRDYLKAWKAGDPVMMEEVSTRDWRQHPAELGEYEKRMLDRRNVGMVAKAQQLMKTKPGPHFLAVGAAHMVGEMGLVNLFKKEGYNVEQISALAAEAKITEAVSNVKKQKFAEQFKIWLPDAPKRTVSGDMTRYEFYETPVGIYMMCIFTAPSDPSEWPEPEPGPLLLDKILSVFKPDPSSRKTIYLKEYSGREITLSGNFFNPEAKAPAKSATAKPPKAAASKDLDFGPYMADLQRRIKRAWFPPKGQESRKVIVTFNVHSKGELSNLKLYRTSGFGAADRAAMKAVKDAAPFLPLPKGAPAKVDIKFTFDYNVFKGGIQGVTKAFSDEKLPSLSAFGFSQSFDKIKAADMRGKVRAYLAGRRFMLLVAAGTKEFVASENVKRFFDSLEILPE